MKIGILTQPLHSNYGGLLQNYALQQTLVRAGHEVETIDWGGGSGLHETLYRIKIRVLHTLFPNKYPQLKYRPNKKERAIIQRNTNHFINTYINHTEAMHSYEEFVKQASKGKYDAYVVGSDQCWRPCYNAFLPSMFLDFVQDKQVKRIAYAASFGTDKWEFTPQQTAVCVPLAKKFDMVSVREDSGVKLCKEHLGVDAVHVLDPTMLLTKEEYIQLIGAGEDADRADTLPPQHRRLAGGVLHTPLAAVTVPAQRQGAHGDALVIVGAGIGQQQKQPVFHGAAPHEPSHGPQSQSVAVPSGGGVVEAGVVFLGMPEVPQDAQHGAAADGAEKADPHGDMASRQALRDEVCLGGQLFLLEILGRGGVQQDVH